RQSDPGQGEEDPTAHSDYGGGSAARVGRMLLAKQTGKFVMTSGLSGGGVYSGREFALACRNRRVRVHDRYSPYFLRNCRALFLTFSCPSVFSFATWDIN